jgi:hypothetical protein
VDSGHFTAVEPPELFAAELREAVNPAVAGNQ